MIENEKSKLVSNEQLLIDIENTKKEQEAYDKLAEGYAILRDLPENSDKITGYEFQVGRYTSLVIECGETLQKLLTLKSERGL